MPPIPEKKPDPASFLLPIKEAPTPVGRVNAGLLLEQEQHAELPKTEPAPSPAAPPVPKEEKPGVASLQTYRGDIEQVVQEGQGVSVVSIAAAEAARREKGPIEQKTPEQKAAMYRSWAMVGGGALLVLAAAGVVAAAFLRPTTTPIPEAPRAPFIFVDDTAAVLMPAGTLARDALVTRLEAARQNVRLPVGLIEWLYVAAPPAQEGATASQVGPAELLRTLAPQIPQELLRTLSAEYLLGVHSFEENQPFLLLRVDSYEVAYRAMLDWERTLSTDLLPLFSRNPTPKVQGTPLPASTTPQFVPTNFVDKVVENRDTRAYLNDAGDILLLWTFLGRNTILITTNGYTLREVVSRLNSAPVVPIPGK